MAVLVLSRAAAGARGLRAERPGAGRDRHPGRPPRSICTTPASSSPSRPRPASSWPAACPGSTRLARIRGWIVAALAASAAAQLAVLPITLTPLQPGLDDRRDRQPRRRPAGRARHRARASSPSPSEPSARRVATWLYSGVWPVLLLLRGVGRARRRRSRRGPASARPGAAGHRGLRGGARRSASPRRHLRDHAARARAAPGRSGALATALASALLALWPALRPADGRLPITVLDVGQGDAIVDRRRPTAAPCWSTPGRAARIGWTPASASSRRSSGTAASCRLAAAVVTHADIDHAGGMAAVRRLFRGRRGVGRRAPGTGAAGARRRDRDAADASGGSRGPQRRRAASCGSSSGWRRSCSPPTSSARASRR